jgi:hypothetical protein
VQSLSGLSKHGVIRQRFYTSKKQANIQHAMIRFEKVIIYVILLTATLNLFSILSKFHIAEAYHGSVLLRLQSFSVDHRRILGWGRVETLCFSTSNLKAAYTRSLNGRMRHF